MRQQEILDQVEKNNLNTAISNSLEEVETVQNGKGNDDSTSNKPAVIIEVGEKSDSALDQNIKAPASTQGVTEGKTDSNKPAPEGENNLPSVSSQPEVCTTTDNMKSNEVGPEKSSSNEQPALPIPSSQSVSPSDAENSTIVNKDVLSDSHNINSTLSQPGTDNQSEEIRKIINQFPKNSVVKILPNASIIPKGRGRGRGTPSVRIPQASESHPSDIPRESDKESFESASSEDSTDDCGMDFQSVTVKRKRAETSSSPTDWQGKKKKKSKRRQKK